MPVIRLFFEKFNIPSEVYANGKVTLPKSWPLYSIFLNTNLFSSFLSVVFFGIVTFIKGFEDDKLKLLFIKTSSLLFKGTLPHNAFNSSALTSSKVNSFSLLASTVTPFKVVFPTTFVSIIIGNTTFCFSSYSYIPSILSEVTIQYILSFKVYAILPNTTAFFKP